MKKLLNRLRELLINLKIYMNRSNNWLTLINSGMILFLFLSRLKETGPIDFEIDKYFLPILLGGFLLLILIGWLEINIFKGLQVENKKRFSLSPPNTEMLNRIRKIEKLLERKAK